MPPDPHHLHRRGLGFGHQCPGNAKVISGLTFDGGAVNLCANCHQARRYMANFVDKTDPTKYTSTSPRLNPDLSVQADILLGSGGFGVEGKPGAHYSMVENTCVGCHMGEGRNHLMEPQLAKCQECHPDAESCVGMAMVVTFLLSPALGVLGIWDFTDFPSKLWAQIIAFALIVISAIWYLLSKNAQKERGINVDFAFKEIPAE